MIRRPHRRLRSALVALVSTGALSAGSVLTAHVTQAAPVRPSYCPARVQFVPGDNNYVVGNPDIIGGGPGGPIGWQEYRNLGNRSPAPGILFNNYGFGACWYSYEIWNYNSFGSPTYGSASAFAMSPR